MNLMRTGAIRDNGIGQLHDAERATAPAVSPGRGKIPISLPIFNMTGITYDYGKTVGWEIKEGPEFLAGVSE